jgi:mRNA-degrading endonuclease RelE of RelBE toxin-antitoxin system
MQERILNCIKKIEVNPDVGKPLRYSLRQCRSVRISLFRLVYTVENENIIIIGFDERKIIYKNLTKYINYVMFYI